MTLKEWLTEEKRKARCARASRGAGAPKKGTQRWLAQILNADQGEVSKWVRRVRTPEEDGPRIVRLSGGKVTIADLVRTSERGR